MKSLTLFGLMLAAGLVVATPTASYAHVGHGDEFQAEGGINRVAVNPETDALMGIVVTPIEAADGSNAVMVPVTALVDADGKQLAFVQYENFYEPVPVTTGATQGDLIEVTEGLSVGEKLVTQGSLSLYAESRKTQTVTEAPSPAADPAAAAPSAAPVDPAASSQTASSSTGSSAEATGNMAATNQPTSETGATAGFPVKLLAMAAGGAAVLIGGLAVISNGRKNKSTVSDK